MESVSPQQFEPLGNPLDPVLSPLELSESSPSSLDPSSSPELLDASLPTAEVALVELVVSCTGAPVDSPPPGGTHWFARAPACSPKRCPLSHSSSSKLHTPMGWHMP